MRTVQRSGSAIDLQGLAAAGRRADLDSAVDEFLGELLEHAADILATDTALILLCEAGSRTLAAAAGDGLEHAVAQTLGLPVARDASNGTPSLVLTDVTTTDGLSPALKAGGVQSLLAVPLLSDECFLGVVVAGALDRREFTDADARVLQALADRMALEIVQGDDLERHRREWSLQRSHLPAQLPQIPGVTMAARYLPASAELGVGGGWYDAFVLPDGRVGLAVGDIANRGRRAATLTGELRNALRAYALDGDPPAAVAMRMWHFVEALERGEMATFLYAVHDPAESSARFYSAGHPGPVFVRTDGSVVHGVAVPASPLGVGAPPRADETEVELSAGTTMLLYTEGLAEVPGERLADRRERIARAAAGCPEPEALCTRLLGQLVNGRPPSDDIALLAVQTEPPATDTLQRTVPALAEELGPLRGALRRWLRAHGADERQVAALTLAAQEAAANAVEHAYGLAENTFDFVAAQDGRTVLITIRDRGRWRPQRGEHRGRGLALMRALVDHVDVDAEDGGTTVRLTSRLGRDGRAS